ncbi:hypothetical protein L484_017295 [Morus notabilis]|uniref:Uncharacterized protein n=1 Tax=Morus notabilis TaxID=981085 RepID=W9S3D8_9ROSA|nr:hypothetical protein L484_017295 [Morus notabilis]
MTMTCSFSMRIALHNATYRYSRTKFEGIERVFIEKLDRDIVGYPLKHPVWPTPIPRLSS